MTDVLARLREAIPLVVADQPVAFAYLFGSHATGRTTSRSDIDVAVHLDAGADVDPDALRIQLAGDLERQAGVGPIEIVVLDQAPLSLAGRIRESGLLIHSRDDVLRVRWDSTTARHYHDFRIHEERSARERLQSLAGGGLGG